MSLGLIKRVALWRENRRCAKLQYRIGELRKTDPSDPELPMAMATLWRDIGASALNQIPVDVQISTPLKRNVESLTLISVILDKTFALISNDDYNHFNLYLTRQLNTQRNNSIGDFLTDAKGIPVDVDQMYIRVSTQLYSIASALDTQETYEYHRGLNLLYKDLLEILKQLLNNKPN